MLYKIKKDQLNIVSNIMNKITKIVKTYTNSKYELPKDYVMPKKYFY